MSVFLKIKDVFSKKSQSKNSEMDYYVHLNDFDYEQICSDFNKEKISEININGISLKIVRYNDRKGSFISNDDSSDLKNKKNQKKIYI
jgi:hypothetical protein